MERIWSDNTTSNKRNISWTNGNFTPEASTPKYDDKVDYEANVAVQVVFGAIAFVAFSGNLLLCLVMFRERSLLRKRYNVLIFNLAIIDMCTGFYVLSAMIASVIRKRQATACEQTMSLLREFFVGSESSMFVVVISGIFLVATPDYVIDRRSFPYPSGVAGEIYCRLIGSTYVLYIFSKASTSSIMFLAIDRWYSIVKPILYKTAFSKRRLYIYITLIWFSACLTQVNELFIATMEDGYCTFIDPTYGAKAERLLVLLHVTLTFYIPSIVTWVTFGHICWKMRTPTISQHINNAKATKRLLRMCALAAMFLTLCWLPAETFFVLYKFEILKLPFTFYLVTNVLAMSNSVLNPWIYCLSNREYRRQFLRLICCWTRSGDSSTSFNSGFLDKLPFRNKLQYFVSKQSASSNDCSRESAYVLRLRHLPADSRQSLQLTSISNLAFSVADEDITTRL